MTPPPTDPNTDQTLTPRPSGYTTIEALPQAIDQDDMGAERPATPLSAYLHALRRRWFMATVIGLVVGGLAAVAMYVINQDQYTAFATFRVSARPQRLIFEEDGAKSNKDYDLYKRTQQQIIKNDLVLIAALRNREAGSLPVVQQQPAPERWLAREIQVDFPGAGEIMTVGLTGNQPNEVATLVAAVVKAYMEEVVQAEQDQRTARLNAMQGVLEEKKEDARRLRSNLKDLARNLGTDDSAEIAMKKEWLLQQLMAFRSELIKVQLQSRQNRVEIAAKQAALKTMTESDDESIEDIVSNLELEAATFSDPVSADLRSRADGIRNLLDEIRESGTAVQAERYEKKLSEDLKEIEEQRVTRRNELLAELRRRTLRYLEQSIDELQSQQVVLESLAREHQGDVDNYRAQALQLSGSSMDVEEMRSKIADLQKLIAPITQEVQQLEVEKNSGHRVTLITGQTTNDAKADGKISISEIAKIIRPKSPDPNSRLFKTIAACVAAFSLIVAGIVYWDVRAKHVNSPEEVSGTLGLQVIGAVPLIPAQAVGRSGSSSPRYQRWRSLLNESMRGVMVRLLHDTEPGTSHIVMVSSATSGEGKTTLSTHLAVALARAGYRTLLMDFDLRRPSLCQLFGLETAPGISEVLRGESTLDICIHEAFKDNLSIITAGEWSPYYVSTLANGDTVKLFQALRERYDFIIVDGSPILGVAEAQLLCRHADTVLLSVLRDVSSGPKITAACETLAAFGVRSLSAVVTGAGENVYYTEYPEREA